MNGNVNPWEKSVIDCCNSTKSYYNKFITNKGKWVFETHTYFEVKFEALGVKIISGFETDNTFQNDVIISNTITQKLYLNNYTSILKTSISYQK